MSKKINITLQGKDIVLNFGVARFYNLFKEATGKDLLNYINEEDGTVTLIELTKGIVYGGYYAECKKEKITPVFSKEEIFDAILDSDVTFIKTIYEKYIETVSSNGVTSGEAVSQLM